jgi:formate hydrogenlyase subunit 6/NADH:ubiquinone oxidoreductase subunit I
MMMMEAVGPGEDLRGRFVLMNEDDGEIVGCTVCALFCSSSLQHWRVPSRRAVRQTVESPVSATSCTMSRLCPSRSADSHPRYHA